MPGVFQEPSSPRSYLLLLLAPTPNGRLHLGHVAGPFLRIDVLGRHLRRRGDHVTMIGGTDAYESYVTLTAHREGVTPEAICARFHPLIHSDFNAVDIEPELFINPLDQRWSEEYADFNRALVQRLVDKGHVRHEQERILYCAASSRYIIGCWLLGDCPSCHQPVGSYLCEQCGHHFRPEEIENGRSRLDEGPLETVTVESLFAEVPDVDQLQDAIRRTGSNPSLQRIAGEYIQRFGGRIRLTNPGDRGVPWPPDARGTPRVVFTYAGLYAYALFCGEQYGKLHGHGQNAFARESQVTTVLSYGIDNAIPMQLGVLGAAVADQTYKSLDGLLGTYFYSLEGDKFSTSRGHAIWAGDIVGKTPLSSDAIRYYTALTNPESASSNFDLRELIDVVNNRLAGALERAVSAAVSSLADGPPSRPTDSLLTRVEALLAAQDQSMELASFRLAGAVSAIDEWIDEGAHLAGSPTGYWWLKSLALLAYPVMPRFSTRVWSSLGHRGHPNLAEFLDRPSLPTPTGMSAFFTPITLEQLAPCLPHTLT
jgi:methionyl-tRNA synthetase